MNRVDEYLTKGFDQKAAEYFASGRKIILSVEPESGFSLRLIFNNGEQRRFDVKPLIKDGTVFAFLKNPDDFARVYLDEDGCVCWDIDPSVDSNKVWSNKIDLSPDSCYMNSELVEASSN